MTPSDIREGLKSYWDLVRTIRDRWKSDAAAVKEAEEKKRNSELPLLQDRVKSQRDMIEVAFKAALEYGHKQITELYVYLSPCMLRWSLDKNIYVAKHASAGRKVGIEVEGRANAGPQQNLLSQPGRSCHCGESLES